MSLLTCNLNSGCSPANPPLAASSSCRSYKAEFDEAGKHNELLAANLSKVVDDLHPVRVLQLFSAIPEEVSAAGRVQVARFAAAPAATTAAQGVACTTRTMHETRGALICCHPVVNFHSPCPPAPCPPGPGLRAAGPGGSARGPAHDAPARAARLHPTQVGASPCAWLARPRMGSGQAVCRSCV